MLVAFVAFTTVSNISRGAVGIALVCGLAYLLIGRYIARRGLVLARGRGRAAHPAPDRR